jgi:hypothetical protein
LSEGKGLHYDCLLMPEYEFFVLRSYRGVNAPINDT